MGRQLPNARIEDLPFGDDPWRVSASGSALDLARTAPVFALGNGWIGLRGPGDGPGEPRVYLNGVYERMPIAYHEAAFGYARESDTRLAVADACLPLIRLDGAPLPACQLAELDMAKGLRRETYQIGELALIVETMTAMAHPGLVAIRVRLPKAHAARLQVTPFVNPPPSGADAGAPHGEEGTLYDPRLAPGFFQSPWQPVECIAANGFVGRVDRLQRSGFFVAALAQAAPAVEQGEETRFDVIASYAAARDASALAMARAGLTAALENGAQALWAEQAAWFAAHWANCAIALPQAPKMEQALRHAMFQLVQAAGRDGASSLPAKGQTGEGYEGHVFWDADLYALPVFAFTRPEIARAMLAWRISGLEAAKANARAMGQMRGALYPWRTIGGRECSSFFPAGAAQYHINADIAFALETYLAATGDASILAEGGAAMLVETARIWLEIGFHDAARGGAFVINRVTGPDEYSAIVDNNLYTNLMAQRHLRAAAAHGREAGLIDEQEAATMRRAADSLLLPFDQERGIFLQDEGFFGKQPWPFASTPGENYPLLLHYHPLHIYRHQVAKQADAVLALALLPERFERAVARRMLDAYEAVTVHDSTLSASAFAIAAARVGETDRAVTYWRVAALTDLADLFGNTGHGLHMAALAGAWSALAMGFAGMRVAGDGLTFAPLAIPHIGPYTFRIRFRGSLIAIHVSDQAARYELIEGKPVWLGHGKERFSLEGAPISRPLGPAA